MKLSTLLRQHAINDPVLEAQLIKSLHAGVLELPPNPIPSDPDIIEELEWIEPLNLGTK